MKFVEVLYTNGDSDIVKLPLVDVDFFNIKEIRQCLDVEWLQIEKNDDFLYERIHAKIRKDLQEAYEKRGHSLFNQEEVDLMIAEALKDL